jgi:hypothetical protein
VPLLCLRPSFGRLVVSQMCYSGEIVFPRPKIVKKLSKNMVKKLSKNGQKVVKSGQKMSKRCKKLSKNCPKSCQKVVKKFLAAGGRKRFVIFSTQVPGTPFISII